MSRLNELSLSERKATGYYIVTAIKDSICDMGNFIWLLVYLIVFQENPGS